MLQWVPHHFLQLGCVCFPLEVQLATAIIHLRIISG